ncbi:hypothetical protein SAMN02745227_01417 [Anaerobranca californiensis DSM 14826]|uniref:PDZ domain-containing protein n=1 Tax=Anaerobranca californiensis DSM 14826 TaxID=1120989 RepID=A0A1M6PDL7_9FIRM|nr:PDZ domain-containing protein [Anaerobranca californiensis]SHK06058.1 hypothetical protein SAMN02745227_01417 [Anaerobranca californiensis DSM 14826]
MFPFIEIIKLVLQTMVNSLAYGFLIPIFIVLLLVIRQYKKQMSMEINIFGISITRPFKQTITSLGYGLIGGILGSIILVFVGVDLNSAGILFVWPVALLLLLYSPRYMCFSYAGGIVGVLVLFVRGLLHIFPVESVPSALNTFVNINLPGLMAVVGILHLVESILIYLSGAKGATPVFVKFGDQFVGGYSLMRFWPVPIVVLIAMTFLPDELSTTTIAMPDWWPLIKANITVPQGYQLIYTTLPVMAALGYSDIAISTHPREKSNKAALKLALYSVMLIILAVGAAYFPHFTFLPVLFAPLAHEFFIVTSINKELAGEPLFVAPDEGVKVLAVLPNSVAKKMGIEPGYIITRVNGTFVEGEQHFKELLVDISTYVKFEVIDNNGRHRHVQAPLFGKRKELGLIVIPKNPELGVVIKGDSPLEKLWKKITGR